MDSRYNHLQHEDKMGDLWDKSQAFVPSADKKKKTFSIIMPPPNANDPLHVGHAMFVSIEDILIRFHRMLGDSTLWLPGTDHAGIETQFVFEKKLAKNKQTRFNFAKKELYQKIWQYVEENSGVAIEQMKKLGASADWSRYKFTLNPEVVEFVTQTFVKMHQDQLIYRDLKLVNYCTKCGTSYSELEVKHVEQIAQLYYIQYGPFVLATTRPETKFADTAVAVHPHDKRYQKYIGQEIEAQGLLGKFKLKVIADEFVDQKFGTGVVKITPYHDFNDFEVWQRHKKEMPEPKQVIDFTGRLTNLAGPYAGLKVLVARPQILEALKAKGLLVKTDEKYSNSVGVCYRCGRIIEPLPLPQFFISVNHKKHSLTQKALKLLDAKKIKIHGAGKDKILRHWLKTLKDWNISRQIVWGIGIPVWYQIDGFEDQIMVNFIDPQNQSHKETLKQALLTHSLEEVQSGLQSLTASLTVPYQVGTKPTKTSHLYLPETDTLDTWFSSAQWPVVTLKTGQADDFARYYPTSVMETAYDILPFWVMRMILMGVYLTGKEPFKQVYFHGLIRDNRGQKMSKSKGNVLNPLEIVEKFGADALRMSLVTRSTAGLDKNVGEPDFKAARNFTNKIWNASRYVLMSFDNKIPMVKSLKTKDDYYRKKLDKVVQSVGKKLENLKLGQAADEVYNQFWHWFCDELIELHKKAVISDQFLLEALLVFIKLLHPFVPFITESVWQEFKHKELVEEELLTSSTWPKSSE